MLSSVQCMLCKLSYKYMYVLFRNDVYTYWVVIVKWDLAGWVLEKMNNTRRSAGRFTCKIFSYTHVSVLQVWVLLEAGRDSWPGPGVDHQKWHQVFLVQHQGDGGGHHRFVQDGHLQSCHRVVREEIFWIKLVFLILKYCMTNLRNTYMYYEKMNFTYM